MSWWPFLLFLTVNRANIWVWKWYKLKVFVVSAGFAAFSVFVANHIQHFPSTCPPPSPIPRLLSSTYYWSFHWDLSEHRLSQFLWLSHPLHPLSRWIFCTPFSKGHSWHHDQTCSQVCCRCSLASWRQSYRDWVPTLMQFLLPPLGPLPLHQTSNILYPGPLLTSSSMEIIPPTTSNFKSSNTAQPATTYRFCRLPRSNKRDCPSRSIVSNYLCPRNCFSYLKSILSPLFHSHPTDFPDASDTKFQAKMSSTRAQTTWSSLSMSSSFAHPLSSWGVCGLSV